MTTSWDPDDPRLRRQAAPGESWHARMFRRAAEGPPRLDWSQRLQRPRSEQPSPMADGHGASSGPTAPSEPVRAPANKPAPQPSKTVSLPKRKERGKDYDLAYAYYYKHFQGHYGGANVSAR